MRAVGAELLDEQYFRQAMQSVAARIAIIDLQGRWVEVNPALARLLGHDDAASLHGQAVSESFHPEDAERAHAYLTSLAGAAPAGSGLPQRYRKREGAVFQALAEVSVMRDARGEPRYLVMHLRETQLDGDRKDCEQSLAEAEQALQSLSRQQEVLAHGISHDLRASLRAIESFSALLDADSGSALNDTGRDHLRRIRTAAKRMRGLIDALLDLMRVDRDALSPDVVDISMLAEWAAAELQDANPGRMADIAVAPNLHAHGNERLLRMLLQQLLDNAWRFSRDRERVSIRVDGHVVDGRLQVAVHDQGSGFDMRYVDKITDPFQRLHTPEQGAGNGIGLAIAKRIVERHGGWLRAQSQNDLGSVFTFEVPAADGKAIKSEQTA